MIGIKNIKDKLQTEINSGGHTDIEISQLVQAVSALEGSFVSSVANFSSLPTDSDNLGRNFYVESDGKYYFSYDDGWSEGASSTITNRELYAWGCNGCGQLGAFTLIINRCTPTQESTAATNWCAVSAGLYQTAALKTTGELYGWGYNLCGSLGDGTSTNRCVPTQESTAATDWCAVSAGQFYTAAIKTTGQLYSWGNNLDGQLGDGTVVAKCVPTQESTAATNWCALSAGSSHTAALKTTGELYAWGRNTCGGLGDGTTVDRCVPTQECTAATDWCAVSAGGFHTAAIKTTGAFYAWGWNVLGQLGDGTVVNKCVPTQESTAATNWCALSAGSSHTAAIKTTDALYAWGSNNCGKLGDSTVTGRCVPTQECTAATDWCTVSGGDGHTAAVKTTGALYAWGCNRCGRLGDGTTTDRCVPTQESTAATDWCAVAAGGDHTAAIRAILL